MGVFRRTLAIALSGAASSVIVIASAHAQVSTPVQTSAPAPGKERRFAIPAGPLGAALNAWSRQSGRSIVFRSEDVATRRTAGVAGRMTDTAALDRLIAGSGFVTRVTAGGAVALQPAAGDGDATAAAGTAGGATPDILVTGQRSWTLNTGIKRSQDDSQPFIVLTGEEIRRSGAPNLETFLRDRLNVNAEPGVSEQAPPAGSPGALPVGRGLSSINLRGLGVRDTLILVDGRRQPGVNLGNGQLTQAQITGIPIASIERIEVLASSASGIYGSGASGGVVNIITRRDFTGGEITARYGNTGDFKKGDAQVDLTYGVPLEGGRTRLAFSGSWQKGLPLLLGDREFLSREMRAKLLANDPTFFDDVNQVPFGTAVNYRSQSGKPLKLKPQYGGATLSSAIGTVPAGFNGIAVDGIAPLLTGVGRYDDARANVAISPGLRAPLLYGSERLNGSLTLRREFSNWLTGYVSANASRSTSTTPFSRGPNYIDLARTAPNNPFTEAVRVALPGIAQETSVSAVTNQRSIVAGAIVKLPYEWQALVDMSYGRSRFESDITPSYVSAAVSTELVNGGQDILRDLTRNPLQISYEATPFGNAREPSVSSTFTPSLRLAGPLPIALGGGRPQMTVNVEYNADRVAASRGSFFNGLTAAMSYQPISTQKIWSAYAEIALPLIGEANNVPLFRQFELRLSARGEKYRGDGGETVNCNPTGPGAPTAANPYGQCPGPDDVIKRDVTRNGRIDPSISFRWFPFKPLMLRGSYTTGFLAPRLNQLVKQKDRITAFAADTARGGEPIGFYPGELGLTVDGGIGGNPDVLPESSRTLSMGAVLTPRGFLDGFRFSADWTQVKKRNVYFDPIMLLFAFDPTVQSLFDRFIRAVPDRVTRAAPSDGFAVGRITGLDVSLANLNAMSTRAVDFVLDYSGPFLSGTINASARASTILSLTIDPFPGEPIENYRGVAPSRGFASIFAPGGLQWRASGWVNWSKDRVNIGWAPRYIDRYRISRSTEAVSGQGSAFVPSQFYHDVTVSYRFPFNATLTAGINNLFNKRPPLDANAYPQFYSSYADPRLRNFYLSMSKAF